MMKKVLLLAAVAPVLLAAACRSKPADDPRIGKLEKDVAALARENLELRQSIEDLTRQIQETQTRQAAIQPSPAAAAARTPEMSVDRMRAEVSPLVEALIKKIKEATDTPGKGDRYGMRIEYDLKHAIFGLNKTKDPKAPYGARVIVRYEKFLESSKESQSYGTGSQQFLFEYRNGKWSPKNS